MVCAPVRSIIPSLKLGDYLRTGAQTMLFLSLKHSESKKEDLKSVVEEIISEKGVT